MNQSDLSFKRLKIFQLAANQGSVQAAAHEMGLSISTVSHHLKGLEDDLGVSLLDHGRRPMTLTPQGAAFLRRVDEALKTLDQARAELALSNMADARHLRLGLIEDFDSDLGPELAVLLAKGMPKCDFAHFTRYSSDILDMLQRNRLDVGIASRAEADPGRLREMTLCRDPFVLAVPAHSPLDLTLLLNGHTDLPLLRYAHDQHIRTQIETQLRRLKIDLPVRFEIESNQTMMAMIAAGAGWAITTPTCYFRARRFHRQVTLHPFPAKGFARYVSLFAREEVASDVVSTINQAMRTLIETRLVLPATEAIPWLAEQFHLLPRPDDA